MQAAVIEAKSAALRTLLRSFGQIVLQPNAVTGACLLAAWLLYDPRLACAAAIGATAANVNAILAGLRDDDTHAGLHGFNGALAGLAAFSFIADNPTAAVAILAATGTAWLLKPWSRCLRRLGLGVYSSPCLMITWLWLPLVSTATPTANVASSHAPGFVSSIDGVLAGFAQTGFASGVLPGVIVLLGLAFASRTLALRALAGATLASAAHLLLGANMASLDAGLLGFNGALTAIALADYGIAATACGVLLSVVLQAAGSYLGLPCMTAPFEAATWSVQWLARRLKGSHASSARQPEQSPRPSAQ